MLLFILLLLVLVLLSSIIGHYITILPIALIQIFVGLVAAIMIDVIEINVETEWFLLLFIAPILFKDGANFPRELLWNMRGSILGNAILLVLITTVVGGAFIHWLIPAISFAAAFALAAILSPTDPVAVNGIAKRVKIPHSIMALVKGESLINDASGLVAFNYAVAAVVTGYFSLQSAATEFVYMFIVGAISGAMLVIVIQIIRIQIRRKGLEDVVFHSLLQLLTPFIIFFIAEDLLHASGVIAVVSAGIIHAIMRENTQSFIAQEQLLTENLWSVMLFVLNGVVFLLLGLTLPSAMSSILVNESIENSRLIFYVIEIGTVILFIRFIWCALFNRVSYRFFKTKNAIKPSLKNDVITTLVGVRGTITMVGILSLPFVTSLGEPFPERQLIIFLAGGVILFTLIIATIFLPLLNEKDVQATVDLTNPKVRMLESAIRMLRKNIDGENDYIIFELIDHYMQLMRREMNHGKQLDELRKENYELNKQRMEAVKMEKWLVKQYIKDHDLPATVEKDLLYKIEVKERVLKSANVNAILSRLQFFLFERRQAKLTAEQQEEYRTLAFEAERAVYNEMVSIYENKPNTPFHETIVRYYRRQIVRNKQSYLFPKIENDANVREFLYLKSLEVQRAEINEMLAEVKISFEQSKELRRFVNYIESLLLFEVVE